MKKILNIFSWLFVFVILMFSLLLILSRFETPIKVRVFSVLSGSMEPKIGVGDLVVVVPGKNYEIDDVVTINVEESGDTVTHRIVEKFETEAGIEYTLKGDANESADHETVLHSSIIGRVLFNIPLLGKVVSFAQTQQGFIFLIIVPAVILVYSELMNIKNEAHRLIKERRNRKLSLMEKVEVEVGEEIEKVEESIKKVAQGDKK